VTFASLPRFQGLCGQVRLRADHEESSYAALVEAKRGKSKQVTLRDA
jgi:hypothetical protein